MYFPGTFYRAQDEMCTYEKHVNAPLIRRTFDAADFRKAEITISGLGFYELYLNGRKITKGLLAPYISNPDELVYFDKYDVTGMLENGKNTVGIILGNGMQNSMGGRVWGFDYARFRNVPCFAFGLVLTDENGAETVIEADESFKCKPSAIIFDDLRSGCFYDANLESEGWLDNDFDDSSWSAVKPAEKPRGEYCLCEADPIVVTQEIKAVEIREAHHKLHSHRFHILRLNRTMMKFHQILHQIQADARTVGINSCTTLIEAFPQMFQIFF